MNAVSLIGRLCADPQIRVNAESQMAVARFSIAIDRGKDKSGESRGTDFPNIVCFGKTAELVEKFVSKGRLVGINGRIQTGKYEKDGKTVYTTDVLADRVEFLDWGDEEKPVSPKAGKGEAQEGFSQLTDDDIPF